MIDRILRFLPSFRGKQRLARLLLRNRIKTAVDLTVRTRFGNLIKIPNIIENLGFEIFINGVYEKDSIDFIVRHLPQGSCFLDIGANIGAITIPVCQNRKDINSICLEAAPWLIPYLKHNLKINHLKNVSVINKAVSDRGGEWIEFFSPQDKFGKGSLASVFTKQGVRVQSVTLDELAIQSGFAIDFIKIDVEGFEYQVFVGGAKLLREQVAPDILFEFVDWAERGNAQLKPGAAQTFLMDCGYVLYRFEKGRIEEKLTQPMNSGASLIFASKKMIEKIRLS